MLAKKFRLPVQEFFSRRSVETVKNGIFLVKIFQNSLKFNRFGVAIGKRAAKKSTDRNRIKRIIFSLLENYAKSKNISDFLVIVGSGAESLTKEEISLQLKEAFRKI